MPPYWIDADIFITAKNGPYGFSILPAFWAWIDTQADAGVVSSPQLVCDELIKHSDDELAAWAKDRKDSPLFVLPDQNVQAVYGQIASHVQTKYVASQSQLFLSGADAWLIAHAKCSIGKVVTHESLAGNNSKKVKIPNVCRDFAVPYVDCYAMLIELGVTFQ